MRWVNPPNERSGACAERSGAKDGEQKDRVGSIVSGGLGHMDAVASGVFKGAGGGSASGCWGLRTVFGK